MNDYRICTKGLWDSSVPGITFNAEGVSNYALLHERLASAYPRGTLGLENWNRLVESMKRAGHRRDYDCLVGVSGGTDSSYLLHLAHEHGLRVLAAHLDNGWCSEIAVQNIRTMTTRLGFDLETWVVDYEEMKDALRSYMRAGLPWIDQPTDIAIKSSLYKMARREGVRYILRGNDFRSEGSQPREWTYGDARQLRYIQSRFGTMRSRSLPKLSLLSYAWHSGISRRRQIYPFYHIEYSKQSAQQLLHDEYGWKYYGGHHHENRFTRFNLTDWLPGKFGIDKRRITLSAQVLSGAIGRVDALNELDEPPVSSEELLLERAYVLKKLDLSQQDFQDIWEGQNRWFPDYPSDYRVLTGAGRFAGPLAKRLLGYKPMSLFQIDLRGSVAEEKPERSHRADGPAR